MSKARWFLFRRARGVGSQAVLLALSAGIAQILIALIYLIAARGSDPRSLGLVVAAIALGMSAAGYIDFGTNSHWVREIARGSMRVPELNHRIFGKLMIGATAGAIWVVITLVWFPATRLWIAAPVMLAILANQTAQVPLRARARGDLAAVVVASDRSVAVTVFLILLITGVEPVTALWIAIVAGPICASILAWTIAEREYRPHPTLDLRTNPWRGAGYFGIASLANSTQSLDLPLLAVVAGPTPVGLYGAVNRWTQPMGLLASAFASASAPFVARSKDIISAWQHLRRGLWMPLSAIGIAISVFIGAPWIVPFLLGDAYSGSVGVLRILALVSIPSIISQPMTVALQALGRDRYVAFVMMGAVALQLVLVAALGTPLGAFGAALASLVTQVLMLLLFGWAILIEIRRSTYLQALGLDVSLDD